MVDPALIGHSLSSAVLIKAVIDALRSSRSEEDLKSLMAAITRELRFRYFALIHHDDLRRRREDLVDIKEYPAAISERLIGEARLRRDPVIRGCLFSGGAFLWSDLSEIIKIDRLDRESLAFGAKQGLNEGITVPYIRLGARTGSCTFAGTSRAEDAPNMLGVAQAIGVFAFQAAVRLLAKPPLLPVRSNRLHPRPRDCIVLAGRGYTNKEIARALCLTPRTVDGYLTQARQLFGAHDRTELVVSAVLAGDIGVEELARCQPE